jgi:hypothetical protein
MPSMRLRRSRRLVATLLVASVVALGACSGDDDDDVDAAGGTGTTAAGATASTVAGGAGTGTTGAGATGSTVAGQTTATPGPGATGADAPNATGSTAAPQGGGETLETRDLSGQDLCPVLAPDAVSAAIGLPIGLAEANPSYRDPNCVYYRAEAGQAVSVTKAGEGYYDEQGGDAEAVSGVGDEAKWSAPQLTLFVRAKGSTLVVSVFQVDDSKRGAERDVAVDVANQVVEGL